MKAIGKSLQIPKNETIFTFLENKNEQQTSSLSTLTKKYDQLKCEDAQNSKNNDFRIAANAKNISGVNTQAVQ